VRPRLLVLFDIDGTLVRRAGPHHAQALVDAVRRVTGRESTTEGIPVFGMLDGDILTLMMRASGLSATAIRRAMPEVMAVAQRLYVRRCPVLERRVIPGVRGLLSRLDRRQAARGLVTGNLTRIGWKKVERAGLRHHFRFGAFADMGRTRTELAAIAAREARRMKLHDGSTRPILIGDTANDIEAARANGFVSVAVATGHYGMDVLAGHRPDLLVPHLGELSLRTLEKACC
jgi:phosphoglycolate phosphatase-like HAD superfamily hydrolase